MRIPAFIRYFILLSLFVSAPVMSEQSIAEIQYLQGQVWVQRGGQQIELQNGAEVYSGDTLSTADTGKLDIKLWSSLMLKLDANSKISIIPDTDNKDEQVAAGKKIIKVEQGASCIEVDHLLDSTVLLQMGNRVSVNLKKPLEVCLSTDVGESHIQLIKGSVELLQLTNATLIALSQADSEISFFNDGTYQLKSPGEVVEPVVLAQQKRDVFKVYLYSSRSYDSATEVNKRFRNAGHDSKVVQDADDKGSLFRVAVSGFETLSAARAFIENVALNLGVPDAWVAR